MNNDKFFEVLVFAIEREIVAAQFYHDLQAISKFSSSVEMFKELEQMEWGHADLLKKLQKGDIENFVVPDIKNLQLSELMVEPPVSKDITYQDALLIAIKREESSKNLYLELAKESDEQLSKNLFLKLASEEAKHKLILETIYDEEILKEN